MPGENLTRIEAQERRAIVDTRSYEIARSDAVQAGTLTVEVDPGVQVYSFTFG